MSSKNLFKISAAGSGKTWDICNSALTFVEQNNSRVLITTYTNRGVKSILKEIKKQNGGVLSSLIVVKTWYEFLLSDLLRPYQNHITGVSCNEIKSFDFTTLHGNRNYNKKGNKGRYINSSGYLYPSYSTEMAVYINETSGGLMIERLENVYNQIYVDETQDLAGYDMNILYLILKSNIDLICCADSKQATYCTHNTTKNKRYSGKNVLSFFSDSRISRLISIEKNLNSRRFNEDICSFANFVYPSDEPITTIMKETTEHDGVFIISEEDLELYYEYFKPCILKYDIKTVTKGYNSVNFGACKGETYDRVLIFPNKPFLDLLINNVQLSSPEKYYVAVTRPRYSLCFVLKQLPNKLNNFISVTFNIGVKTINALKYQST